MVFLAIWLASEIYDRVRDESDDGDLAEAHRQYVAGEIDEQELEARIELAVDPRADELRSAVEQVNGVGPDRAAAIRERV
jgi:hypothetical protein